jgi:peroxiredoxin
MSKVKKWVEQAKVVFKTRIGVISSETMAWLANIMLHAATIPSLLAVSMSLTDKLPSVDLVLLTWGALTLLFAKAVIVKDMLNVTTIGGGFIVQSVLMMLIFFK